MSGDPHDEPDAPALLEAVREFLAQEIEPQLDGRLRYHLKVAANVVAIVERELRLGPEHSRRHRERLRRLGFEDDAALSAAIRAGGLDGRLQEVAVELRQMVADKLAVARPRYMGDRNARPERATRPDRTAQPEGNPPTGGE